MCRPFIILTLVSLLVLSGSSVADPNPRAPEVRVAVASNFLTTMQQIAQRFEQEFGIKVQISSASSGKITTQIEAGAPYDLFLSADRARPQRLIQSGRAIPESLATYAIGRLVLVSHSPIASPPDLTAKRLAIANPQIAPYGFAAKQWLEREQYQPDLIMGENINQVWHFYSLGAVPNAIVALSQVLSQRLTSSHQRILPSNDEVLAQGMILLNNAPNPTVARQLHTFILSDPIQRLITESGYRVVPTELP